MRVGIVTIFHESNTFVRDLTTLDMFREGGIFTGEAMRQRYSATQCEVGGFFATLAEQGVEAVPVLAARATPYGVVTAEAWHYLIGRLDQAVEQSPPLDGWLVAPHGAMVSATEQDADGAWLTRLRERVGNVPVIGTLDLHANLSRKMVSACDALIGYRTNPHLDQMVRGREAAMLMVRTIRGEVRPKMAAAFPPVLINIERQLTEEEPVRSIYELADKLLRTPGVLSNTVLLSFPYSDVKEIGTATIAVADGDEALARRTADSLGAIIWQRRRDFVAKLISVDEAVQLADNSPGPVGLLDMGDNVGGGSPGDRMGLVHALVEAGFTSIFVCICAPNVVKMAQRIGTGARGFKVGVGDPPLEAEFTVRGLFDGKYTDTEVRHGGQIEYDQGPTAVLEADGLTVMCTTRRAGPWSLAQLTAFGVDPEAYQAIVIKGVHAPVAAYAPVCPTLIRVDTPGPTCANLDKLTFKRRRKPLFPFER